MFRKALLAIFIVFFPLVKGANAAAATEVDWAPTPEWVSDTEIPDPVPDQLEKAGGGVYYLLSSKQGYFDGEARHEYLRIAKTITNRRGLEGQSFISLNFRPGFETLVFHRIRIHRAGEVIDLTGKLDFEVFRRERDLDEGIVDGVLTAFANIPRIRVGDTIEFSFSRSYTTILMSDQYFASFRETYGDPSAKTEFSVTVPVGLGLKYKAYGAQTDPKITSENGFTTYRWSRSPVPASKPTKNQPDWYLPYDLIEVSSIGSWKDVARDSQSRYPDDAALPKAFADELEKIRAGSYDHKRWVAEVLKLVQRTIRYVGIEIGRGAFVPRDPETVVRLGYGDCKDKAYLMATALRRLGIDAVPALADSDMEGFVAERLPSPYAFNHMIVRVRVDGETYWLDPTLTYQYSPDPSFSQVTYGYALPISADATGLEKIEPVVLYQPQTVTTEIFTLGNDENGPPFTIDVVTEYTGADADAFRRTLAEDGPTSIRNHYLDYYDEYYGGVEEIEKARFDDDKRTDKITVTEKYRSAEADDRDSLLKDFPLRGDAVRSQLWSAEARNAHPVRVGFPLFKEHRLFIRNLHTVLTPLDSVWWSRPYLDYSLDSKFQDNELSVTWRLRTKQDHVATKNIRDYAKLFDDIDINTQWYYDVRAMPDQSAEKSAD